MFHRMVLGMAKDEATARMIEAADGCEVAH